jgi:hypothetical protein
LAAQVLLVEPEIQHVAGARERWRRGGAFPSPRYQQ